MKIRALASVWLLVGGWALIGFGEGEESTMTKEDMMFKADLDGTEQRYVELRPKGFDPKRETDVVIALHGHGGDRWQFGKGSLNEGRAVRDFAAQHGMLMISPDYRARTSWMGPAAEADMVQLISILKKKHKVRKVIFTGASMGGASVLIFATLHPDLVDGVVSMNGMANMETYKGFAGDIAKSYGGDKKQKPEEYHKRSAELFPERLTMPLAFTVGGGDSSVPPHSVRRLVEALKKAGRKDVLLLDRLTTGHSTSYADAAEAMAFVYEAVQKEESKSGTKPASRLGTLRKNIRTQTKRGK